jgi:beta-glucosidase
VGFASGADPAAAADLAAGCQAAVVVVGLDWRNEGEHIHPGDIAPILRQVPPPDPLRPLLDRRGLRGLWSPVGWLMAAITRFGSARPGGNFAAGDRTDLALDPAQQQLISAVVAANPRTVVVLMGGGAILTEPWRQAVPAIVLLGYPGEQGGHALADVLDGRMSPSGRLPYALPTDATHLPPFDPRASRVIYDLWHGYRRLRREGHAAAFPFGFGLSYSRFEYGELTARVDAGGPDGGSLRLELTVANRGPMAADDVVQVYVDPPGRVLERPARVLAGFTRLDQLAPGEQRRVALGIPLRRLAYFDPRKDVFCLEDGRHGVRVARHAEDEGLAVELILRAAVLGP